MPLRITVFPEQPDYLLVYAPEGSVMLPTLFTPFNRGEVASACSEAGVEARVGEAVPGRWTATMAKARRDEKAEARQRQNLREAADASALRNSPNMNVKERSELVIRKQAVDESIRVVKVKIAEAKSNAFKSGVYMDRNAFHKLERRMVELKQESQAIQTRLGALRKQEADGNRAEHDRQKEKFYPRFVRAARELLDDEMFQELVSTAEEDALDEAPEEVLRVVS